MFIDNYRSYLSYGHQQTIIVCTFIYSTVINEPMKVLQRPL